MTLIRLCSSLIFILYLKGCYGHIVSDNKLSPDLKGNTIRPPSQGLQKTSGISPNPTTFNMNTNFANALQQQNKNFDSQQAGKPSPFQQQIGRPPLQNLHNSLNLEQQKLSNNNVQLQKLPNYNIPLQENENIFFQSSPLLKQKQQINLQQQNGGPNFQQLKPSFSQGIDLSQTSMPIINGEVSGLPSQVSQGVLLSNLGLTSSLPSLISNTCNQNVNQPLPFLQNNVNSNTDVFQLGNVNSLPAGYSSVIPNGEGVQNNLPTSIVIPLSSQSLSPPQENGSPKEGFTLKSIHLTPLPQGFIPSNGLILDKHPIGSPYEVAQKLNLPYGNMIPNSLKTNPKSRGSKSVIKNLLPFLLNLLHDDRNFCGCQNHPNNCMNQQRMSVPLNKKENSELSNIAPQVSSGYSNTIKYGHTDIQNKEQNDQNKQEVKENDSEEFESAETKRRSKHRKHKNRHNDDAEYDDEYYTSDESED